MGKRHSDPFGARASLETAEGRATLCKLKAIARLDSSIEVNYYRNGGILQTVLRSLLKGRELSL